MATEDEHQRMRATLSKLLDLIAGLWTLNILYELYYRGPTRFGKLKRRLGSISTRTLTERLRSLEGEGLVARHYEPTVPPQVTYSLTKKTDELGPAIVELQQVADKWYGGSIVAPDELR